MSYLFLFFTPEQVGDKNPYRSYNAIQFMIESLEELDTDFQKKKSRLHFFMGENLVVLKKIKTILGDKLEAICCNRDYTPYAVKRDTEIEKWCETQDIKFESVEDYLLGPIGSINKSDGKPYTVFTPFKNAGFKMEVAKPDKKKLSNFTSLKFNHELSIPEIKTKISFQKNEKILCSGGRFLGKQLIKNLKNQNQYNTTRNSLSLETSHLSAYIKFGCISIREVYHKIKEVIRTTK